MGLSVLILSQPAANFYPGGAEVTMAANWGQRGEEISLQGIKDHTI